MLRGDLDSFHLLVDLLDNTVWKCTESTIILNVGLYFVIRLTESYLGDKVY